MSFGSSKLAGMPVGKRDQLASCVKLLLLWVAASDGSLDDSELEFASSQLPDAEGVVSTPELLNVIRQADLETIELAIAGTPFTEPGNPGDPAWWEELGTRQPNSDEPGRQAAGASGRMAVDASEPRLSAEQARAVLGVKQDATPPDVERAYQGLAGIFQVERVEAMGPAAVAVASRRLKKMEEAYHVLQG